MATGVAGAATIVASMATIVASSHLRVAVFVVAKFITVTMTWHLLWGILFVMHRKGSGALTSSCGIAGEKA
jgi:hypothetical protein